MDKKTKTLVAALILLIFVISAFSLLAPKVTSFYDNFDYGNITTLNSIWNWTDSPDVYPATGVPTLSGSGFITHDNSGVGSLDSSVYHSAGYSAKFTLTPTINAWSILYKDTPNKQFCS